MAQQLKIYSPQESRYSARIKDEEWERHREKLMRLHNENVPRKQMLDILKREDDFSPSLPQLDARLNLWGLRRYEKSTPNLDNSDNSALGSQNPVHPAGGPVLDQPRLFQLELEGVGGGFEEGEDVVHAVADNPDVSWIDLGDPGRSYRGLDLISGQLQDQMTGRSGYLKNRDISTRRFGYKDAFSSGGGPVILTPATSTPFPDEPGRQYHHHTTFHGYSC